MEKQDNKLVDWIINNLVTLIQLLVIFAVPIAKVFLDSNIFVVTLIVTLIIETSTTIGFMIWRRISYKSYYYPKSRIKPEYIILEKCVCYQIENGVLNYSRSMKILAKRHNLTSIIDKYIWTGSEKPTELTPIKNIKEIALTQGAIGIWNYFNIVFAAPLNESTPVEIEYQWPVLKDYKSSSPFVSTSTDEPTKKLTMTVILGREYAGKKLILEEFRAIEGVIPINVTPVEFDRSGQYSWTPSRTKRFRHYRMRWSWNHDQDIVKIQQPIQQ